jgi:acyl carrier protein
MEPIWGRITEVLRDVFQDDELQVAESTTAADVQGWDSLMHVTLIVNIEREFGGLRFGNAEISALKTVGDIARLVRRHVEARGRVVAA